MIVLDASLLVKLVVEEERSREARAFVRKEATLGEELVTVDVALAEVLNALWRHVTLIKDLSQALYEEAVQDLLKLWDKLEKLPSRDLALRAAELALKLGVTIYDALYLAAAAKHEARLATYDHAQAKAAEQAGVVIVIP